MRRVYPQIELKPCPFCGGVDIRVHEHPGAGRGIDHFGETVFSLGCYDCGGTVPNRYRLEPLLADWNRRPPQSGE